MSKKKPKPQPAAKRDSLKAALSKNAAKAEQKEKERLADIDAKWNLYARSLLGEPITPDEESRLPAILEELRIYPEQVEVDQANIEKLRHYEEIIAQAPTATIDQLRKRRDDLEQLYQQARRAVTTAVSYQSRRGELQIRVDAIRNQRPELWRHVDAILGPVPKGLQPQPTHTGGNLIRVPMPAPFNPAADAGFDDVVQEPVGVESVTVEEPAERVAADAGDVADVQDDPVRAFPRAIPKPTAVPQQPPAKRGFEM